MKVRLVIVLILVVFSIVIALTIFVINNKNIAEVDQVAINDIIKTVEENWGKVSNET